MVEQMDVGYVDSIDLSLPPIFIACLYISQCARPQVYKRLTFTSLTPHANNVSQLSLSSYCVPGKFLNHLYTHLVFTTTCGVSTWVIYLLQIRYPGRVTCLKNTTCDGGLELKWLQIH